MEFIKVFIIVHLIFLLLQFIYYVKLEPYQYTELVFGSFFIVVFFGIFASILCSDMQNSRDTILNKAALFAIMYIIWFYCVKKITNFVNSDKNGVINY
jgi:Na+/proline symporter